MNIKTKRTVGRLTRLVAFLVMLVVLVSGLGLNVSAATNFSAAPYDTYTYWSGPGIRNPVSTTPLYEYKTKIDGSTLGIPALKSPQDVFTDNQGKIYIMDTANGRLLIVSPEYKLIKNISVLKNNGEDVNFAGATGVFARDNGDIYIADTENARVIICDISGTVKNILTLPEADIIPDDFNYRPSKIAVNADGFVYVLSEGSFYGAITYDASGKFSGFYGSNSVKSSILGIFSKIMGLIFRNDAKRGAKDTSLPFQFTDIAVDDENFIYTATGAFSTYVSSTGQFRKLSPGGSNVLKNKTSSHVSSAESFNFSDGRSVKYADKTGSYSWHVPDLRSVDIDKYGYMYGLDREYGHIFIYDQDCNLLGAFGGGLGQGYQNGTFVAPFAIHVNNSNQDVLICDKMSNSVMVFKETEYGKLVKEAQSQTSAGAYVQAKPNWEKVIKLDRNNQLAYRGLARAALISEDYKSTLTYAKSGFDQDSYASAFSFVRNADIAHNFILVFLFAAIVVGGLIAFLVYTNKRKVVLIKHEPTRIMFSSMMHPFESFQKVKYENKGSVLLAFILMVLYFFSNVFSAMYGGFIYQIVDKSTYNAMFVMLSTAGLVLLWVLVNWGMATLFEGKGTAKQVYIATCYALLPQIISAISYTILSNIVVPDEALIMVIIYNVCNVLSLILLCVGMMTVHEFGFGKFIGISIITLIGMIVLVFIMFMVGILIQQFISFIITLINEVRYR